MKEASAATSAETQKTVDCPEVLWHITDACSDYIDEWRDPRHTGDCTQWLETAHDYRVDGLGVVLILLATLGAGALGCEFYPTCATMFVTLVIISELLLLYSPLRAAQAIRAAAVKCILLHATTGTMPEGREKRAVIAVVRQAAAQIYEEAIGIPQLRRHLRKQTGE